MVDTQDIEIAIVVHVAKDLILTAGHRPNLLSEITVSVVIEGSDSLIVKILTPTRIGVMSLLLLGHNKIQIAVPVHITNIDFMHSLIGRINRLHLPSPATIRRSDDAIKTGDGYVFIGCDNQIHAAA